jgi:type III secretion protein R
LTEVNSSTVVFLLALAGFGSFFLLFITSFVKIAIVFGLLRSALGTPQIPPTTVITGIAVVLSIYIMFPVFSQTAERFEPKFMQFTNDKLPVPERIESLKLLITHAGEPLRKFLDANSHANEKETFYKMAQRMNKTVPVQKDSYIVLMPSFLLSEITEAFQIGFLLFLPFLILDLLVANILMALGMHMLSPVTISLPFKLLLFVAVDGFMLLSQSLVASYVIT